MVTAKKKVIVLVGPTAVGKTTAAIKLALKLKTEIISADSRQCFKELNIGVAKPSNEQLNEVKHYFINSHNIHNTVNAGIYENYALQKAKELFETYNTIVMVGGTGLYINAFCQGMDEIPTINNNIREQIINDFNTQGLAWLQEQVKENDWQFWQQSEQQNPHRLMRALEVKLSTNISILEFRNKPKKQRFFDVQKVGLELPKEELYNNINTRVDEMIREGLLNEVITLKPFEKLNALQTVGYKEIFEHLEEKFTLKEAVEKIKINTRHYAKRQMTWFKKDNTIKWINPNDIETVTHL